MDTIRLYEKIESIKTTISNVNEKYEQWIQRQNLQDLYRQLILGDIDFTIDKKLEQDLWNNVFKSQINYFQTQIKDKKNLKRVESQANLYFFLENARGFYTKLLEDIIQKFHLNVEFCKNFNKLFEFSNDKISKEDIDNEDYGRLKEKQLMYLCQHILTHLGDIARYEQQYEQAKTYYLHAIKLVPYLGHPYNQIGILYETTRIQQLSTVFYYMRSIAVKFTFPLAATNLENFFHKLIDIPLSRYTLLNINDVKQVTTKDFIQLYLQINAFLYLSIQTNMHLLNKIQPYLDLFKQYLLNLNKNFLNSIDLQQYASISIFMFNKFSNDNSKQQFNILIELFINFIESLLSNFDGDSNVDCYLSAFYLIFVYFDQLDMNVIFSNQHFKNATNFWDQICKLLNEFQIRHDHFQQLTAIEPINNDYFDNSNNNSSENIPFFKKYMDYALSEERILDCFIPLKDYLKNINFKKYLKFKLSDKNESFLRKLRIIGIFERLIQQQKSDAFIYLRLSNENLYHFSNCLSTTSTPVATSPSPTVLSSPQQQQQTNSNKKRRQNVAILGMQQQQQLQQMQNIKPIARPTTQQYASLQNGNASPGFPSFLPTDQINYIAPIKQQQPPIRSQTTDTNQSNFPIFPSFFDTKPTTQSPQHQTNNNSAFYNMLNLIPNPTQNIWSTSSTMPTTDTSNRTYLNSNSNNDMSTFNLDFNIQNSTPSNTNLIWSNGQRGNMTPTSTSSSSIQQTNLNLLQTIWSFNPDNRQDKPC